MMRAAQLGGCLGPNTAPEEAVGYGHAVLAWQRRGGDYGGKCRGRSPPPGDAALRRSRKDPGAQILKP
jgi:hypothetical protein